MNAATDKRDDIIHQAYEVFYKEGFHASGVDSLLEGTGISKRTLYKYFASKEDLIKATIQYYQKTVLGKIAEYIEKHGGKNPAPAIKILLMFDWLEDLISEGHVLGCFAVNAKLEYANKHKGIEAVCDSYFAGVVGMFEKLCREYKSKDPKQTAQQIHLVFQGAVINSQVTRDPKSVQVAKAAVKMILEQSALSAALPTAINNSRNSLR